MWRGTRRPGEKVPRGSWLWDGRVSGSPRSSSCRSRRYVSVAAKSLETALTPTLRPSSQCVAARPRAATSSVRTRSGAAVSSSTRPHSRSPPQYAPPRASSSAKLRTPRGHMARAWVQAEDSAPSWGHCTGARRLGAPRVSRVSALVLAVPCAPALSPPSANLCR